MNGALGIAALFVGFTFFVYAAKGSHGTAWDGSIAPGPVLGQLLIGRWPYGGSSSSPSPAPATPSFPAPGTPGGPVGGRG